MAKIRGVEANRTELADIFGVSLITVDTWVRSGCPYVERARPGRPWRFDTVAVSHWLIRRAKEAHRRGGPLDASQERARKDKELADAWAMQNARLRAGLISVADARAGVEAAFAIVRAKARLLPSEILAKVVHATNIGEVEQIITEAIRDCLSDIASGHLT